MLYKHPERSTARDKYLDEESSDQQPTVTSVYVSPQIPKESVPATPVLPPRPLKSRKTPLPRPKPPIELMQRSKNSSPKKVLVKASTDLSNIDNDKASQIAAVPLPKVMDAEVVDVDDIQDYDDSTVGKLY